MRTGVKRSASSHSEPSRRYHNLLYIPLESGYESSSGISPSSSTTLSPIEYVIYPIGLRKVLIALSPLAFCSLNTAEARRTHLSFSLSFSLQQDQVRRLEDDYQRFTHIYQSILIRLDKLESLLLDAERVLDLTRISVRRLPCRAARPMTNAACLLAASSRRVTQCSHAAR